jgi:RNA polymerase sigma-70 factor (ECF subfamily)
MDDHPALGDWLAATAKGDAKAFARLYDHCSPHLYPQLLRILKRQDWAEEALQDCFLRIWQKAETYTAARGAPMAWIASVARYRALDMLRSKRPEDEMPEFEEAVEPLWADTGEDPLRRAEEGQGLVRLHGCLDRLQQDQRRSVLLAYYEGYTHQELTAAMKAPLGTVKSWVRRGLAQLRDCLDGAPAAVTPP